MPAGRCAGVSRMWRWGTGRVGGAGCCWWGRRRGRVADVAVGTGQDAGRVLSLVVKSARGREYIDVQAVSLTESGGLVMAAGTEPLPGNQNENALLLRQDLLDRQIIDVYGRKVVRVNDVDLRWKSAERG